MPFLGSQEWAAISFPLDDLASVELVRGPSSALYGANAFNGVLNLVTKQPRYSEGGLVRLTGGELSTFNGDLRQAGEIGGGWYYKLVGGYRQSDDFTVSRVDGGEYGGPGTDVGTLPRERIPLVLTDDEIPFGGARLEKYLDNGHVGDRRGRLRRDRGPGLPDRHRPRPAPRRRAAVGAGQLHRAALERARLLERPRGRAALAALGRRCRWTRTTGRSRSRATTTSPTTAAGWWAAPPTVRRRSRPAGP